MTALGTHALAGATAAGASLRLAVANESGHRTLRVAGPDAASVRAFEGDATEADGGVLLVGPLSPANAAAVREHVPGLNPQPIGLDASAGTGDRLGVSTAGQTRAWRSSGSGLVPVFAQQSIREMDRLGRTPQEVMDDATFGLLEAGWDRPVGSDADHLHSIADIDRCIPAGFTMFTLDPGDEVVAVAGVPSVAQLEAVPWAGLEDSLDGMLARYAGLELDLGSESLALTPDEVRTAAVKYGGCVALAAGMYRHLVASVDHPFEVEFAIDETDYVTTIPEHAWLALELQRLGVDFVSFAPRYLGTFEKGVEYIGPLDALQRNLEAHAALAQQFGPYKISLHSGSDKFSIYPLAAAATNRVVHLKTSGTTWLVAVDVAAHHAPDLFREIYAVAREAYRNTSRNYHVSADLAKTPEPDQLTDADLPGVVAAFDSRQLLHVGYGAVLRDHPRAPELSAALKALLTLRATEYGDFLEVHLGRHLAPFSA
ncbi:MAG: tagaturonate epimerase family protein [Propionicimonas sp.]